MQTRVKQSKNRHNKTKEEKTQEQLLVEKKSEIGHRISALKKILSTLSVNDTSKKSNNKK
jgi:hypothetical protein